MCVRVTVPPAGSHEYRHELLVLLPLLGAPTLCLVYPFVPQVRVLELLKAPQQNPVLEYVLHHTFL